MNLIESLNNALITNNDSTIEPFQSNPTSKLTTLMENSIDSTGSL